MTTIIEKLKEYDNLYFNEGDSPISDLEYDILKSQALKDFPDDSYFKTAGSPVLSTYTKIKIPFVVGGLTKVTPDDLNLWTKEKSGQIIVSEKLDGESIICTWVDGKLSFASTRGDGTYGQDILMKAKYFIPEYIKTSHPQISLRGEMLLQGDTFKQLNFKNRRNGVAGLIRRDLIDGEQLKHLSVVFYELIEGPDDIINNSEVQRLEFIKNELGLNTIKFLKFNIDDFELSDKLSDFLLKLKDDADYDIDGLVITLNNSIREDVLLPKNKVKFKVNEKSKLCKVVDIVWNVTRTGVIKPVVIIEPTDLSGATVTKASGFNYEFIVNNEIGKDSIVGVVRSGDVIPYITDVIEKKDVILPEKCPSCNNELSVKGKDLFCNNVNCEGSKIFQITHFLERLGVKNISSKTISALNLNSIFDLFELKEEEISTLSGFGKRKAEIIINELKTCLTTEPYKLLSSFGIPLVGRTLSKELCSRFTFDELFEVKDVDELGLGPITSQQFIDNFYQYKPLYEYLKTKGLKFIEKTTSNTTLNGMNFTLTGNGPLKRKEIQKLIEDKGGQVKDISKDVNFLVTNNLNSQSSKTANAKKFGISIITYDELFSEYLK